MNISNFPSISANSAYTYFRKSAFRKNLYRRSKDRFSLLFTFDDNKQLLDAEFCDIYRIIKVTMSVIEPEAEAMIKSKEVSSKNVVYVSFAQRHKKHPFVLVFLSLIHKITERVLNVQNYYKC